MNVQKSEEKMNEKTVTKIPEFKGFDFDEEKHLYTLNGVKLPSVTEIMKPLADKEYKAVSEEVLNHAAKRGTAVHNAIENWIKYEIDDISEENRGYFNSFLKWWTENTPELVGSEIRAYHRRLMYAGTVDLLCYIGGKLTLVDYKTTYTVLEKNCAVQLEAYNQMLKSFGICVERKMILHLTKTGEPKVYEYPVADLERLEVFKSLKCVYSYLNG